MKTAKQARDYERMTGEPWRVGDRYFMVTGKRCKWPVRA